MARSCRSALVGGALLLAACKPAADEALLRNAADTTAPASQAAPPAPRLAGLSEDERLQTQQDILGRFMSARYKSRYDLLYADADCAGVFTVADPTIVDAMLGEGTGKLRVLVSITAHTIPPKRGGTVPTDQCYGFTTQHVTLGNVMRVPFEFRVEKWQTGWRLAQMQPGEPFQLAPR